MTSALNTILVIGVILVGLVLMILGRALGLAAIIGPWVVRCHYWCLGVLTGRVRLAYTQAAILVLGALSIWLTGGSATAQAWGSLCGLAGQPFWLWTTWRTRQWGIFALAVVYTVSWGRIAWGHWG